MDTASTEISVGGFTFFSGFDSGNLARVELVEPQEPLDQADPSSSSLTPGEQADPQPPTAAANDPDFHFSMWTRPDCAGTEFENGNRTWFYYGIKDGPESGKAYTLQFTFRLGKQKPSF